MNSDAIVAHLEELGMRHRTVTVWTEGDYLVSDADWNAKDVPHLNHIHTWVHDLTCVAERDLQATISFQRVLGIPIPIVLVHYDSHTDHQTHFETLLAWSVITDIEFVQVAPMRTRVITRYTVCSNRFWMLFFPVIKVLIKRNYKRLMAEDLPMRDRRGALRRKGYTFRGDGEGMRDIRHSLPVRANNVVPPEPGGATAPLPDVPLSDIDEGSWTLVGESDHLGLKLRRDGRRVLAFARMCPHEGADLDPVPLTDRCQVCPWHGRTLDPVAVLDLDQAEPSATTAWHELRVDGDSLQVTVLEPAPGRAAAPAR